MALAMIDAAAADGATREAMAMVGRWLVRRVFRGTFTGVNVVAALRLAQRLGPGATVVTVGCDTGMKYLSKRP